MRLDSIWVPGGREFFEARDADNRESSFRRGTPPGVRLREDAEGSARSGETARRGSPPDVAATRPALLAR